MKKTAFVLASLALVSVCVVIAASIQGDPARGDRLFTDLECAKCHIVNEKGGTMGPALSPRPEGPFSPNGMAGAMWSHAVSMWQAADKAGVKLPALTDQQAADIHAFVAGTSRPDIPGNAERGRRVYEGKLCASCHDQSMLGAPDLAAQSGRFSAYRMIAALTAHGRGMLSRMAARSAAWQTLTPGEMGDLIAFLNSRK